MARIRLNFLQEDRIIEYSLDIDFLSPDADFFLFSDHDQPLFEPEMEKYGQPDS
jgi:hypothetical protein